MMDQVFAKTATQRKSETTRKFAIPPVAAAYFVVVIAPMIAIHTALETDPTRSTG